MAESRLSAPRSEQRARPRLLDLFRCLYCHGAHPFRYCPERPTRGTVAALYVDPNGVYADVPDIEIWDEARDARKYAGPWPVVAHPPCARWSRLAGFTEARYGLKRGDDGGCFEAALHAVRTYGGVLEHPAYSDAWKRFALPRPTVRYGWTLDFDGAASCYVEQGRYGLPVKKATWLYAYGVELPELLWGYSADANGDPENQNEHGGMDAWRDKFKGRRESWIAGAPNRAVTPRRDTRGSCHLCGVEIEPMCDVCERHAMSHEQLAELGRRISQTQIAYYLELWPELKERFA